ncbi:hypothetical protein [Bacillus coahuilensis]|uniref:hypothetical protein n=1 Tax=Bacillus coahuilensis TaxID=408580 RepID=UPI0002EEDA1F
MKKIKGLADYDGNYIKTENATPFEIWLATRMDEAIEYETTQYKWQRPVSFTNWVTTDLLDHSDYEPLTDEDLVGVNPNVMKATDAFHSGIFASYHIYPYYPDVLNHDPDYVNYVDHRGEKNNYAGYLNELKRAHNMPILVAEFGIPSSRGMTHRNVYGFNQGNHDETEQGEMIRHLYEDIAAEQYAGGLVFSWQDEWFKRTWNTQTLDNPDRRPYWSNAQTNEQQFGLLSFDPTSHKTSQIQVDGRTGDWEFNNISPLLSSETESLSVTSDERYLYIQLQMNEITEDTRTTIVFDTILNQGQSTLPFTDKVDLTSANVDFALFMKGKESARLMVDSYYDPYYYQYGHLLKRIGQNNYSHKKDNGVYHPIQLMLSNQLIVAGEVIPLDSYETGKMQFGTSSPEDTAYNSLADINVNLNEDLYEIRIPWLLLNMKDPSLNEALGDFWRERTIKNTAFPFEKVTQTIEEIHIGAYMESEESVNALPDLSGDQWNTERFATYKLEAWEFPSYHERLKPSYYIMKDAFEQVDAFDLSKNTKTDGTE